jgi:hypothetical protein
MIEAAFMIFGIASVWWIRRDRWVLKAALATATEAARSFQPAVEILGQKPSEYFPSMSLWRAAQSDETPVLASSSELLRGLKDEVYSTYEKVRTEVDMHDRVERYAETAAWLAAAAVLACIAYAASSHSHISEFIAIWLPSALGAIHAVVWRKQLDQRIGAGRELLAELAFVRVQLLALTPDDKLDTNDPSRAMAFRETVRVLCRAVAEHTQRQLEFAMAAAPKIPV